MKFEGKGPKLTIGDVDIIDISITKGATSDCITANTNTNGRRSIGLVLRCVKAQSQKRSVCALPKKSEKSAHTANRGRAPANR